MPTDIVRTLQSLPQFERVEEPTLEDIAEHSQIITKEKNSIIYEQGDPADNVYLVLDGEISKILNRVDSKNPSLVGIAAEGNWLGVSESFQDGPEGAKYMHEAVVREDATLLEIPGNYFQVKLLRQPHFFYSIIEDVCASYSDLIGKNSNSRLSTKITHYLLSECIRRQDELTTEPVTIEVTQGYVAKAAGTSRENVSTEMGTLRGENLISTGTGSITIHNPLRLLDYYKGLVTKPELIQL